ncbi:MAG: phosphoribosyltransferase [Weeksellaceae bacterium]|nr:phosphoribosyltransferase [Weeksellaceae bacterium]
MEFKFETKIGEKHIDKFINDFYLSYKEDRNANYTFNLENVEWISNQALLLITSLLKNLYLNKTKFRVIFCELNYSTDSEYRRKIVNVINLWDNWKIYRVVPDDHKWEEYFKFKNSIIPFNATLLDELRGRFNVKTDQNLYNRIRITPFIQLEKIENYIDKKIIDDQINPIFELNAAVSDELSKSKCEHPFLNNTISHIITKELYENYLDHVNNPLFKSQKEFAFMSLSLRKNMLKDDLSISKKNFAEEELQGAKDFFFPNGNFLNKPIVEYSFLDFGEGITNTLVNDYKDKFPNGDVNDNEILKYSFEYYSSRHPIKIYNGNDDEVIIPRGLFDVLTVVKRYGGLMIIRSNRGKLLFDFSSTNKDKIGRTFGSEKQFFPGTFITIYLPSFDASQSTFDNSSIKPQIPNFKNKIPEIRYINISSIYREIANVDKGEIYNKLIQNLIDKLANNTEHIYINCLSFNDCSDERLNKIALFFLLSNYEINLNNNIIIFNPPPKNFINNIAEEVKNLSSTVKDYNLHPIPLIYGENDIEWLGIFDEDDKKKLLEFFNDLVVKSIDDFNKPHDLLGNFQYLDGKRNLYSLLSHINIAETLDSLLIKDILDRNNCVRTEGLYYCNGNYYQKEFVQLLELLNNEADCDVLVSNLFKKLGTIDEDTYFIAITSSSHRILNLLIKEAKIDKDRCTYLDSYLTFDRVIKDKDIISGKKYILVGDVLSGGSLAKRVELILKEKGSSLYKIAVLINTIDDNFKNSKDFLENYKDKIHFASKYTVKKYIRQEIDREELRHVIRINPYTNLPSVFSDAFTLKKSIIFANDNRGFLDFIKDDDILINYKIFNNLIHPYFFKLQDIIGRENILFASDSSKSLISTVFNGALKYKITVDDKLNIFYPKGSDIESIDWNKFKSKVINNHSVKVFELERFNINEGWKFPHTTDSFDKIITKKNILIIDDGSCSGDSILQMVNELAYFKPKKIDVVSLIGRVNDHKREFFSRIKEMRIDDDKISDTIEINIYFASHWHIPTFYLGNSPFTEEINWIKKVLTFQNLPSSIRNISELILSTLTPKDDINEDYRYLPTARVTGKIPKKEIILLRDEIGKVIGYRFYRENFSFFNEFIYSLTDTKKTKDRYKNIELLCICLLYEPYIYERISNIMPDIKEKIEEFIDSIFFGLEGKKKLDIEMLYYDWTKNRRDLIHLFFIIYSNHFKLKQLDNEKLDILLNFATHTFKKTDPSNYILYKLLKFFPLTKSDILPNQGSLFLKEILLNFINSEEIKPKAKLEFKRFYSFLNTLPTAQDFPSQLQKIKDVYWENDQPKNHDNREAYSINFSIMISSLRELKDSSKLGNSPDKEKLNLVKDSWWNLKTILLNPIISFFRSHEDFFTPYPYLIYYNQIDGKKSSLINLYSFLEDFVNNIEQKSNDIDNFNTAIQFIEYIDDKYGSESDEFRDLFRNSTTQFQLFRDKLFIGLNSLPNNVNTNTVVINDFVINIPQKYVEKIILEEILNNLKFYADNTKAIDLTFSADTDYVEVKIENSFLDIVKEFSSNEGINCLNTLSESSLFNFKYDYSVELKNQKFIQILKFNIHG